MYWKDENVTDIIDQMENVSPAEKLVYKSIFESLKNRQNDFFDELKKEINAEENEKRDETIDIYTLLADKEQKSELEKLMFNAVCTSNNMQETSEKQEEIAPLQDGNITIKNQNILNEKSHFIGMAFWNGTYDEKADIKDITEKIYYANVTINGEVYEKQAEYSLVRSRIFIENEKMIHSMAIQYGIETPLIYNPMARRALEVWIRLPFEVSKRDIIEIDLQLEKYNIKNNLLLDKYLMWNVDVKDQNQLPPAKSEDYSEILPMWDKEFMIYRFNTGSVNDNHKDYILIENSLRNIKRIGSAIYWQCQENHSEMRYSKITIYDLDDNLKQKLCSQTELFHNEYEPGIFGEKRRVRTIADAMACINAIALKMDIKCQDIYTNIQKAKKEGKSVICTYSKDYDYYQIKDDRLRCAENCVVCFEKSEDVFYVDKISYILGYMNNRYPEYRWIGVN